MNTTNQQDDPGKLFVGGLHPTTIEDSMKDYFSGFGQVVECQLMTDNITKRSRGFGFVTFADARSAQDVIDKVPHILDGKQIDVKKAVPKGPRQSMILKQMGLSNSVSSGGPPRTRNPECKVFVGGISQQTSDNELRAYFSEYGNVIDVAIPLDRTTGNKRGFAFVGFDNPDTVQRLLRIHFHQINGRTVEVKSCDEQGTKQRQQMQGMNGQFMGAPGADLTGAGAFGQPDRSGGAYGQNAYGAYGSMLQQAAYAGAPGAAASPYGANYGGATSTAYPDPNAYGQAGSALQAYGAGYGTMSGAATSQYGVASTTAMAGQTPPTGAAGAGSATDYASFGQMYGFGNYQQEASSFGPSRNISADLSGYGSVGAGSLTAAAYGSAGDANAAYGVAVSYADASGAAAAAAFGRGAVQNSANQRGYHPYVR